MTAVKHSRCLFCSLGCEVAFETQLEEALALEYTAGSALGGKLCSKGNYLLELINHPQRLTVPRIAGNPVTWQKALEKTGEAVSGAAAAVVLSGDASVEDIRDARAFVDQCVSGGVLAIHAATDDNRVYRALSEVRCPNPPGNTTDIASSQCIVAVGDPFEVGPVIARPVLDAKHRFGRDMVFAAISEEPNRTSRFAATHIGGSIRKTLAGLLGAVVASAGNNAPSWAKSLKLPGGLSGEPGIQSLAASLMSKPGAVLIPEAQDQVAAVLASLIVEAAGPDVRLYPIFSYGNIAAIADTGLADATVEDVSAAAVRGDLKTLIALGADVKRDPKCSGMFEHIDTVIAGAPFANETVRSADVILPTAVWLECAGTYGGAKLEPVVSPPGSAQCYGDILRKLAETMGKPLKPAGEAKASGKDSRESAIKRFLDTLGEQIGKPQELPRFRSTTTKFGDGAITDMMSWFASQEREAW